MSPIHHDLDCSMPSLRGRARPTALAVAVAMALAVSHPAMSQNASASDVQALKSEVQQLQRKIERDHPLRRRPKAAVAGR